MGVKGKVRPTERAAGPRGVAGLRLPTVANRGGQLCCSTRRRRITASNMSALLYGALTAKRETTQGDTTASEPPGFKTYIDGFVALVPADVLAASAALTPVSTDTTRTSQNSSTVATVSHADLKLTFFVLVALGPLLYLIGHTKGFRVRSTLSKGDIPRMLIPAAAFVGWSAAQHPSTLFDAAISISDVKKAILIVVGAIVLGAVASALGIKADRQNP
jgi:hypothetical protein